MFVTLLTLLACGESVDEAPAPKLKPVPPPSAAADEAAAGAKDEYFYNPAGKRDPFQGFLSRDQGSGVGPDTPPLQRYEVDKFLLTGVIHDGDVGEGLLLDPEGLGHVVRLGTYVGRNWGKVTSIAGDCIVVTEEYQTIEGDLVVNPVTLCFPGAKKL